jgi:hypothetical protein
MLNFLQFLTLGILFLKFNAIGFIYVITFYFRIMKTFVIASFVFCGSLWARAQNPQTHTIYIYSFAKMIQWPEEDKKGDFEILVLGEAPILAELQKMAERKRVGDRSIKVVKINSLGEFQKGHILFIPAGQSGQLGEVLAKVGDKATLVVTEQAGLASKGSDINFILKEGRTAFELNQAALMKHKLKAATELVKLATII